MRLWWSDGALYAGCDVGEADAALPLQCLPGPAGDHDHGSAEGGHFPRESRRHRPCAGPSRKRPADLNVSAMISELVFCSPP
jgi:hypothetical protein